MGHRYGGEPRLVMSAGGIGAMGPIVGLILLTDAMIFGALIAGGVMPLWAGLVLAATLLGVVALVWGIVPRRYEVYDDRLVLVFALWRWNIGMDSIDVVREAAAWQSYGYWGLRFSTNPAQAVELRRLRPRMLRRPNLIISPEDRIVFLAEMSTALARYRRLHGGAEQP